MTIKKSKIMGLSKLVDGGWWKTHKGRKIKIVKINRGFSYELHGNDPFDFMNVYQDKLVFKTKAIALAKAIEHIDSIS
ncbi:MAG: hypothetical protein ACTSW1_07375 [Candidatus Hodarchaeales archaeon]